MFVNICSVMRSLTVLTCGSGSLSVRLPDGLTRRGDINVLLLGDPGTAKSQLLKFVENCSPIGVSLIHCAWWKYGNVHYGHPME